jgi:hypothetical protein
MQSSKPNRADIGQRQLVSSRVEYDEMVIHNAERAAKDMKWRRIILAACS